MEKMKEEAKKIQASIQARMEARRGQAPVNKADEKAEKAEAAEEKKVQAKLARLQKDTCSVGTSPIARAWSEFWAQDVQGRNIEGCQAKCKYTIIMSVTQNAEPGKIGTSSESSIVQGYAVVGDASSEGNWGTEGSTCAADEETVQRACEQMLWVPDSIVRDALADVRFNLGAKLLAAAP